MPKRPDDMGMRRGARLALITGALALAVTSSGKAQDLVVGGDSFAWGLEAMDSARFNSVFAEPRNSRSAPSRSIPTPPSVRQVSTAYRSSPAVTQTVKRQYVAFLQRQLGEDAAAQARPVIESGDHVRSWANIVANDGLRPGDVADALASYWILNWIMANGTDSNRAQAAGVRRQVHQVISSTPAFARLTEPQRQEMAEALMLNFLMQHAAISNAHKSGDRALVKKLGDAAVARFRAEMNVDLRQLRLTDAGFVRRS